MDEKQTYSDEEIADLKWLHPDKTAEELSLILAMCGIAVPPDHIEAIDPDRAE